MPGDTTSDLPEAINNIEGHMPRDRISALPDETLQHVLSFLDMKEVVQTSFLSKRWRHAWKPLQDLTFDYSLWEWEDSSLKRKKHIRPYVKKVFRGDESMAFVDKVLLIRRDKTTHIRKIKLSHNYCCDELRIHTWLMHLLPTIKEVDLDTRDARFPIAYPDNLFTSNVQVFVLKSRFPRWYRVGASVGLPRTILCSHLKTLRLQHSVLPKGDSDKELRFITPVLETLNLIACVHPNLKVLNIIAPKLKELVIRNAEPQKANLISCEIKLCIPNLLLLELYGACYMDYALGDLSALVAAKIGSPFQNIQVYRTKVLQCLHNASTLELFGSYEGVAGSELEIEFNHFLDLRRLGLFYPSRIPIVTKLLWSAPSVNTLSLESSVVHIIAGDVENERTEELQSQDMFFHVRCVKIVNIKFHENELKFLTYLLQNSKALNSITVTYSELELNCKKKDLARFRKKLQSLQKGSSCVTTVHLLKRPALNYF